MNTGRDYEVEQLKRELPPGWNEAWRDRDGLLHAKRSKQPVPVEVSGKTISRVVALAVVKDGDDTLGRPF